MEIKDAIYVTSVTSKNNILDNQFSEIAFVGRSNVGKSSLINMLCNRKGLAKTSATPGKTKMINYFQINNSFIFVDLPGYGFSKTGKQYQEVWSSLIGEYLLKSKTLKSVFVLLDIRVMPSEKDKLMLEFLIYNNLPFKIILTKTDKLSSAKQNQQINLFSKDLKLRKEAFFLISNINRNGRKEILDYIEAII